MIMIFRGASCYKERYEIFEERVVTVMDREDLVVCCRLGSCGVQEAATVLLGEVQVAQLDFGVQWPC